MCLVDSYHYLYYIPTTFYIHSQFPFFLSINDLQESTPFRSFFYQSKAETRQKSKCYKIDTCFL